jgi:putative cell wall-binding protein
MPRFDASHPASFLDQRGTIMKRILALLTVLALAAMPAAALPGDKAEPPAKVGVWSGDGAPPSYTAARTQVIGRNTYRISGADRFATAAAISQEAWSFEDTFIVYLASGGNFPDALGLGASTFDLGPLLLVSKTSLPDVTRQELARLRPCFIVAVGGAGAISDEVLRQADAYTMGC